MREIAALLTQASAAVAAGAGAVRRAAAAGAARRAARAARGHLPAADAADRRAAGADVARARARHRRSRRPGGVADAREPDDALREATTLEVLRPLVGMDKDEITDGGRADRHAADLEHSGPGLLSAVHAAAPGDARRASTDVRARRGRRCRSTRWSRGRRAGVGRGGLQIPGANNIRLAARSELDDRLRRLGGDMFSPSKRCRTHVKPAAAVLSDRVSVTDPARVRRGRRSAGVDRRVRRRRRAARHGAVDHPQSLAAAAGIRPASIHDLYMAMGRGDAGGFTVPAINVRAMAYDTARAVIRAAKSARTPARSSSRSRARRSATPSSARTNTRRSSWRRRCAKASAGRSSSRAITSRRTPRSTTAPTATRSSTRCARSSRKRSPPGSTTSTSTPRRSSISTSRRSTSSRR